jgi:DsbC/DsbD-like thiol-disulfide interchange protein
MSQAPLSHLRRAALALALAAISLPGSSVHAQIVEVGDGGPGPVKAEHLTVELTSLSPQPASQIGGQIAIGGTLQAGLVFTMEEHWHVYWINAGDSGEPPHITWTLPKPASPPGPCSSPPRSACRSARSWTSATKTRLPSPSPSPPHPSLQPGKVHLDAQVTWLVCSSVCLPGKAHLGIDIDVVRGPLPAPPLVGALGEALTNLPKPLPAGKLASAIGDGKHILRHSHHRQQAA